MTDSFASQPITSLVLLGALTLLPFVFMTTTSFVKISVVLSILRNALGTGQVPSGMVIAALSAILSFFVMAPVGSEMLSAAEITPANLASQVVTTSTTKGESRSKSETNYADWIDAFDRGKEPLRKWLHRNSGKKELSLFLGLARKKMSHPDEIQSTDFRVVLPAFLITELAEAFQIGFLIFIPFLVIDMVVSNVLLALGMHMLSPTTISLPFKLLMFVLVNGWYLLSKALVLGYA